MKLSLGPYSGSREDANATWSTSKWTGAFTSGREMYEVSHLWYRGHYCIRYVDNLLPLGLPSSNPLPSSSGLPHDRTALRTRVRTNEDR